MLNDQAAQMTIGWREWIALPALNVGSIKAKIDTGANTSSLHAFEIERFSRRGKDFVRFQVHPIQRSIRQLVNAEAPLLEMRRVKSSNGQTSERPVIETSISIFDQSWPIELTLANRDQMGFRMLLGREALRGRFLVDVSSSFIDKSHRPKKIQRRK